MGMSEEEFYKEHGSSNDISKVLDQVKSVIWTISYVIDDLRHSKAVNVYKKPQSAKNPVPPASSVKQAGPSEEFAEELVFSLKSFRIKGA
jgi:hypothetical protein